jgi:uncharacterized membrane protein
MNVSAVSLPAPSKTWKRVGWVLLLLGAIAAAGNAVVFMVIEGFGSPAIKSRFLGTAIAGWAHTMGGAVAVLIGPFQLLTQVRVQRPELHRWLGRAYLIAVLAGGLGGLYFAPNSTAATIGSVGFTILAVFWLYSGARAYLSIRRGDVQAHRAWMLRNYALTFAAATLRIELPLLIIGGFAFPVAYNIVAWSSWVPNWLIVEAWLRRGGARRS